VSDTTADASNAAAETRAAAEDAAEAVEDSPFQETLQEHKHGTVTTDLDYYDVRNIRFNTGHGFVTGGALVGYYLNTRYELKVRFIEKMTVVGKISSSEARAAPHRFDMIEDKDLDFIFRTQVKKTDGERIEFIVRINDIQGELQEGGSLNLTEDELKTLRKIVFY